MLATAALCLLTHLDPSHFAGALTDGEVVQDLSQVPVGELTLEQMHSEMDRTDKYRTEFIAPTVMGGAGAVVLIIGAVFEVLGIFYAYLPAIFGGSTGLGGFAIAGYVLMALGGVAMIVGGIFLTIGLVKLFPALSRRRDAMERRQEIQQRLDAADPSKSPPPPPLPPGDVRREGPMPSLVLATF